MAAIQNLLLSRERLVRLAAEYSFKRAENITRRWLCGQKGTP